MNHPRWAVGLVAPILLPPACPWPFIMTNLNPFPDLLTLQLCSVWSLLQAACESNSQESLCDGATEAPLHFCPMAVLPCVAQAKGTLLPLALLASPRQPHSWEILVEMSTWQMEAITSFHKNALLLRKWKLSEVWELNRVIGVCFNRSLVVTAQKFPFLSIPFSYTHNLQAIGDLWWLNSLAERKMLNAAARSAETSLKPQHLPAKQKWWAKK